MYITSSKLLIGSSLSIGDLLINLVLLGRSTLHTLHKGDDISTGEVHGISDQGILDSLGSVNHHDG